MDFTSVNVGDRFEFGSYDGEDVVWRVLAVQKKKIFVISEKALARKNYHDKRLEITWEDCTLRKWLNSDFYNVTFSAEEKDKILLSDIKNPMNTKYKYHSIGGNDTSDYIFLLSISEASRYFADDKDRKCWPKYEINNNDATFQPEDDCCVWWLRSPGDDQSCAACVFDRGYICYIGRNVAYTNRAGGGVRPAMWLSR